MSTITIPQPELTTEEVSAALRKGLGEAQVARPARAYPRQARTAWTSSPARLSSMSCRI
jgi:hypothetical protein